MKYANPTVSRRTRIRVFSDCGADRHLCHQPVPAQFRGRDRPATWRCELSLSRPRSALLSSSFFLSFAAAQIPVGIAIDRYGPKNTMLATALLAVAGTVLFALAPSAGTLIAARALMGLGCSTFLHGAAGHLCPALSAGALRQPDQPADWDLPISARSPPPRRWPCRQRLRLARDLPRVPFIVVIAMVSVVLIFAVPRDSARSEWRGKAGPRPFAESARR